MEYSLCFDNDTAINEFFSSIPVGTATLYLSQKFLGPVLDGNLMAKLLPKIPASVTSLHLTIRDLGSMSKAQLMVMMHAMPETINSFALTSRGTPKEANQIQIILSEMHANITSLDLSWNKLNRMLLTELTGIMLTIPQTVASLSLRYNDLGFSFFGELAAILDHFPATVTLLDLSWNNLGEMPDKNCVVLGKIPMTVTSLDLSHNNLSLMGLQELLLMLEAIPPHVTLINLQGNNLFKNKTRDKKDALLIKLRQVKPSINLDLSDNGESDAESALEQEEVGERGGINLGAAKAQVETCRVEESTNEQATAKKGSIDLFKLMFNILAMKEAQLAAVALGAVILLSCSSVGMVVIGGSLVTAGAVGLAMNFFSPGDGVGNDTGYDSEITNQTNSLI